MAIAAGTRLHPLGSRWPGWAPLVSWVARPARPGERRHRIAGGQVTSPLECAKPPEGSYVLSALERRGVGVGSRRKRACTRVRPEEKTRATLGLPAMPPARDGFGMARTLPACAGRHGWRRTELDAQERCLLCAHVGVGAWVRHSWRASVSATHDCIVQRADSAPCWARLDTNRVERHISSPSFRSTLRWKRTLHAIRQTQTEVNVFENCYKFSISTRPAARTNTSLHSWSSSAYSQ